MRFHFNACLFVGSSPVSFGFKLTSSPNVVVEPLILTSSTPTTHLHLLRSLLMCGHNLTHPHGLASATLGKVLIYFHPPRNLTTLTSASPFFLALFLSLSSKWTFTKTYPEYYFDNSKILSTFPASRTTCFPSQTRSNLAAQKTVTFCRPNECRHPKRLQ